MEELLTVREVMAITKWSKAYVYKIIEEGRLNAVPLHKDEIDKPIRVPISTLPQYLFGDDRLLK